MFKRGKAFYLFDPLGIEVKEKKIAHRRAVLYKFETVEFMVEQLMNIVNEIFDEKCEEAFEVGAVFICPSETPGKVKPKRFPKNKVKCLPAVNHFDNDSESISESSECSTTDDNSTN